MSAFAKYVKRGVFEAVQFDPAKKPWPRGVEEQDCYCAAVAQDGRHCELHKEHGRRYGNVVVDWPKRVEISKGDWLVRNEAGKLSVYSNAAFLATFAPFP